MESRGNSSTTLTTAIQRRFGFILRFGFLMVAGANSSTTLSTLLLQRPWPRCVEWN
ncbi:MAG: hypothetical protein IPN60_11945 [Saprospiraceae bacterium]|nr:hypothetical protein [Candidatus Opimibacter skivensis]